MRFNSGRLLRVFLLLIASVCVLATAARADLVWSPNTGWRVEGGALSGLAGANGRTALDTMNRARANEEAGNLRSAIKQYLSVSRKYPNAIYAPEALYRAGMLYLKRRDYNKAFGSFQEVLGRYPNTSRFNEIIGIQYQIATQLLNGARGRMFFGLLPGFRQRERGLAYLETVITNAPYGDYAPLALMEIAHGHVYMHHSAEAIDALDRMINNYPQSVLTPDAYLLMGQTDASLVDGPYYDQAATKEAITYFTDFMLLYPSDPNIGRAEKGLDQMKTMLAESKIKIGDFYFYKRDNYKAARVFYNEAITSYPDSPVANQAKAKLAQVEAKAAANAPGAPAPKKKHFWFF